MLLAHGGHGLTAGKGEAHRPKIGPAKSSNALQTRGMPFISATGTSELAKQTKMRP